MTKAGTTDGHRTPLGWSLTSKYKVYFTGKKRMAIIQQHFILENRFLCKQVLFHCKHIIVKNPDLPLSYSVQGKVQLKLIWQDSRNDLSYSHYFVVPICDLHLLK